MTVREVKRQVCAGSAPTQKVTLMHMLFVGIVAMLIGKRQVTVPQP